MCRTWGLASRKAAISRGLERILLSGTVVSGWVGPSSGAKMFKRLIVLLLLLGPLTAPVAFAANGGKNERVALLEMSKADAPGFSRVSLVFPKLPVAKVALSVV